MRFYVYTAKIARNILSVHRPDSCLLICASRGSAGLQAFWAGVIQQIVTAYHGQPVDVQTVRVRKGKAVEHLQVVAALLPEGS